MPLCLSHLGKSGMSSLQNTQASCTLRVTVVGSLVTMAYLCCYTTTTWPNTSGHLLRTTHHACIHSTYINPPGIANRESGSMISIPRRAISRTSDPQDDERAPRPQRPTPLCPLVARLTSWPALPLGAYAARCVGRLRDRPSPSGPWGSRCLHFIPRAAGNADGACHALISLSLSPAPAAGRFPKTTSQIAPDQSHVHRHTGTRRLG